MKKKILSLAMVLVMVLTLMPGMTVTASANTLDTASTWAREHITNAIAANLVPAALQNNYQQTITRAEFCALAVVLYENVMGEITGRVTFTDTNDVNVQKMAYVEVVGGVGNDQFNPNGTLTREQAAVMASRLSDAIGQPFPIRATTFSDFNAASSWALEGIGRVQEAGLMGGTGNNNFSPQQPYTREQSIITFLRFFEMIVPNAPVVHTDGDFRYTINNGEATVTGYIGEARTITVPATLGGYTVTAIGDRAFAFENLPMVWILRHIPGDQLPTLSEERLALSSVSLPESVTTIGDYAFANNPTLRIVPLCTGNVTTIGNYAFYGASSMSTFIIRRNVTSIGENAFSPDTTTVFSVNENSVAHAWVIENGFEFRIRPLQQHD